MNDGLWGDVSVLKEGEIEEGNASGGLITFHECCGVLRRL